MFAMHGAVYLAIVHAWSGILICPSCSLVDYQQASWLPSQFTKLLIRHVQGHAVYYIIACNCTCAFLIVVTLDVQSSLHTVAQWCKICTTPSHCTRLYSLQARRGFCTRVLHQSWYSIGAPIQRLQYAGELVATYTLAV